MPAGPGDPDKPRYGAPPHGRPVLAYQQLRARTSNLAIECAGTARAGPLADLNGAGALQYLDSCLAEAQRFVSSLRGSRQPIATEWAGWIRSRRAALRELVAAACGENFSVANSRVPPQARAPAPPLLDRIEA